MALLLALLLAGAVAPAEAREPTAPVADTPVAEAPVTEVAAASDAPVAEAPAPTLAERLKLDLSLRAGVWAHDRQLNGETVVPVGAIRARVAPRLGAFDLYAEGYVQADRVRAARGDLVEGWLRYRTGSLELVAGRRIVVWGRADRLNPTDMLSSRDYTLLVASDDEQRRGVFLTQARLGLGAFTLDAYWLPEFRGNRFPLERERPGVAILPDQSVSDRQQFALKLDRSGGRIDWSLSWFHGTDRSRDFTALAPPPGSRPGIVVAVQQTFPRLDMWGGDAAGTLGRFGWRLEAAYSRYRGADTVLRRRDNLWLVAGVDTDAGPWNFNLQYSWRHIFDRADLGAIANPVTRQVALLSAAVNNQLDADQHGVTARVARKWLNDTLDTELSTIAYLPTGDAAIRPKATYAINDHLRLTVGADVFLGPSLSYFGRVRRLSGAFLQLTRGF